MIKATINHKRLSIIIILVLLIITARGISFSASVSESAYLITYGADAETAEGDNDFLQVIFIRVPYPDEREEKGSKKPEEDNSTSSLMSLPLYFRIFDPDCGGKWDGRYWFRWTTRTRFRLFAGKESYSHPGLRKATPDQTALSAGVLIADEEFGEDSSYDNQWHNFARILPTDQNKIENASDNGERFRYFKLVIEGKTGKDGNVYDIVVSRDPESNISDSDVEIFTFSPTLHLMRRNIAAEIRFFIPPGIRDIIVHNFDLAKAMLTVNTAFRQNLPVIASGQDEWQMSRVRLDEIESGRMGSLWFRKGDEMPNDATFFITDHQGDNLPIQLPIRLFKKRNSFPEPHITVEQNSDDCYSFFFDASGSTDPDKDDLRFYWDFGDGIETRNSDFEIWNSEFRTWNPNFKFKVSNSNKIKHRYEKPGQYDVRVVVADISGQVSNSTLEQLRVTVNHAPIANAGKDQVGAPGQRLWFDGSGSSDPDGKIRHYTWHFGDGKEAKGRKVRHIFKKPGKYNVRLQVEDNSESSCSTGADTCEVRINAAPVAHISVFLLENRGTAAVGEEIRFSATQSHDTDGEIISYEWDMGDGTKKSGAEIIHIYDKSGTYKVRLAVSDNSETRNRTAQIFQKIIVNEPPVAKFKVRNSKFQIQNQGSIGETIRFDGSGSVDNDGKLIEFKWDFGDGTQLSGPEKNVTHQYEKPGAYLVILTVTDDSGSASNTAQDKHQVIINDPPIADAGPDQWITRSEVRFDGSGSFDRDGEIIEYLWEFGDGNSKTGSSPVHVFHSPGIYTVRLTITDNSKTDTNEAYDEMTVTVNHLPIADAGPDRIGSPGKSISFDASGSIDPDGEIRKVLWNFGDGNTKTGIKVSHVYDTPGKYNVLLTVYDNSEDESAVGFDEAWVVINQSPVAIAKPLSSKGIAYGKKRIGTEKDLPARQNELSAIVVAPDDEIRFNGTRSYDSDGKIISYQWDIFGNRGKNPDIGKPVASFKSQVSKFKFSEPGVYTVTLTVIDDSSVENSTSQDRVFIRVNSPPIADAGKHIHTNEKTIFLDGSGSADADGDTLTYTWDFGDGTSPGKGEKVFHTYAKRGNYPVILTVNDGTGLKNSVSFASITIRIDEAPIADAGGDRTVCAGKVVIFDGSGSVDPEKGLIKFHWDFGDGTTAQGINPTKIYRKGGAYPVTLTVTDDSGLNGNVSTDQIVVKVIESPVADAGQDQTACAGTMVRFDGTKSKDPNGFISSFLWDFGDGITGMGSNPVHAYSKAGIYRVRLTVTGSQGNNICTNTDDDETKVMIQEAPEIKVICPEAAEKKKRVTFEGRWIAESEARSQKPEARSQESGVRSQESGVRSQKQSAKSKEQRANTQEPTPKSQIATKESQAAPQQNIQWHWDFGDGIKKEGKKISHTFTKPGNYIITLTATADSDMSCNTTSVKKRLLINETPVAKAGDDRLVGVNQIVIFDGSGSFDSDGAIASYIWDFGDGESGTGIQVRHQYKTAGRYSVVLKVSDNTELPNNSATDTLVVTVNEPPKPVIRILNSPSTEIGNLKFCAGEKIVFDASDSSDEDGEIINYIWNFGDGSPLEKEKKVSHIYRSPGAYLIILETDDGRLVSNSRVQSSVPILMNHPPVADAGQDYRMVSVGEDILFDGSVSRDHDGSVSSFQWDFGDGSRVQGRKVTYSFQSPGKYKVRLLVTDDSKTSCNSAEDAVSVRVNAPPVAKAVAVGLTSEKRIYKAFTGGAHDAILFDGTNSHDPDDDPLILYWDFGDGMSVQGAKVTHQFKKPGKYDVRLRVDDGTGLKSGVSWDKITIQVYER